MRISISKLDFWAKLTSFLIFLPLSAFFLKPQILVLPAIVLLICLALGEVGCKPFWRQSRNYLVTLTISLIILSLAFTPGDFGSKLTAGTILSIRFILFISFGKVFSMVTNSIEFPTGFMRAKIPHKYGVTLMVGYRMMPLLKEKILTIIAAQRCRGATFRFSIFEIRQFLKQVFSLIIPLMHSTLEISVKLSDTLISRGYNPDGKISYVTRKWESFDYGLTFISLFIFILSFLK